MACNGKGDLITLYLWQRGNKYRHHEQGHLRWIEDYSQYDSRLYIPTGCSGAPMRWVTTYTLSHARLVLMQGALTTPTIAPLEMVGLYLTLLGRSRPLSLSKYAFGYRRTMDHLRAWPMLFPKAVKKAEVSVSMEEEPDPHSPHQGTRYMLNLLLKKSSVTL